MLGLKMVHGEIQFEEDANRLRMSWDNRTVRKDQFAFWGLLLFWIIWAPVTCIATVMIFTSNSPIFFLIWCIFGWLGAIGIPLVLAQRSWCEWIQVESDSISWGEVGLMARKPRRVAFSHIEEFGFGRYNGGDGESLITLNIFEIPKAKTLRPTPRHLLGYWLSEENKQIIFDRVSRFVAKRSLPLKVAIYGQA